MAEALDSAAEAELRAVFAASPFIASIGAQIHRIARGEVELRLPFRADLTQHSGVLHAGVTTTIADHACGCAAATEYAKGSYPLTTEFKINLLAPAKGEALIARGRVVRSGSRLATCAADVFAVDSGGEEIVATMLASIFRAEEKSA